MKYFSDKTFKFLNNLHRNNNREWFNEHKADYETHVRQPFLALIGDFQAPLAKISSHYVSDPRAVGGSLFRINRDARFSKDKSPYKHFMGARFYHEKGRDSEAPKFYFHLQHKQCFIAAGHWYPEAEVLRKVRQFILDNPASWKKAVYSKKFREKYSREADSAVRVPRGFPADHEFVDDLRLKSYVASVAISDEIVCSDQLLKTITQSCQELSPMMDYLCAALDLEF
ncbi:MAG TPA: DUF2461 domain-containing protein [Arenimonas sp.]|nr:DUF2461 domain-containing protein [Arenimonas sp.]HPO23530.1 DUF2461 domain-containing protein [Arenimonas sp.]HPW31326.1 DUF2461 domain-containing protein [Arenimonas sp.]